MRCSAVVLAIALTSSASSAEPAGEPNRVVVDGAQELGVVSSTHSMLTVSYARRLWQQRLYAEARLGSGYAYDLLETVGLGVLEVRLGAGVVLRRDRRVEVRIGWRVGDTYLHGSLNEQPFGLHTFAIQLAPTVAVRLASSWRLRITPVAPTLYWNQTYAGSMGLEAGVEYAL